MGINLLWEFRYYINIAPVNTKETPSGEYNALYDLRRGEDNYISASAQIILDASDSSIMVVYERFDGIAIVNNRSQTGMTIFRYNTTSGVRGFARHIDYGQTGGPTYPWAEEYEQYTHYFNQYQNPYARYPYNYLAIRFKQWQNTLRVVDVQYRVRRQTPGVNLNFTEKVLKDKVNNYELLAGEEKIGALQPVVIFQNMSNEIQGPGGVNYVRQDLRFRARVRIVNSVSGRIVYNRIISVDSTCLALSNVSYNCSGNPNIKMNYVQVHKPNSNYTTTNKEFPGDENLNGIPPYGFTEVFFPPFEPNPFYDQHIGKMRLDAFVRPEDPWTGGRFKDRWPFDDTLSVRFNVMKRLDEFTDDVSEYHFVERVAIPSVNKWVNIDAEVVPGDDVSHHPLPPRGEYAADNNENYILESPVIRMTRKTHRGKEPLDSPGGDELRSFPIDMRNKYDAVLSLSIQRTASRDDWDRGWSDQQLIGAEPRTILNGDVFNVWKRNVNAASYQPDELLIEFARPSPDGVQYVTNIPDENWRHHPRRGGAAPVTDMAALTLYGGGGYMVGFLESDKDSALSRPANGRLNGLRPNIYDDGIDRQYQRFFIPIPDTIINAENEGAKNFRFRLKVNATDDKKCLVCIPDDDDAFFVDNIRIMDSRGEQTDIGISSVSIDWPYTMTPASQATKIPVNITIHNNTAADAASFLIQLAIWKKDEYRQEDKVIACGFNIVSNLQGHSTLSKTVKLWNARLAGPGEYRLEAVVRIPGGDLIDNNDTTYKDVRIRFGKSFAYDPVDNPRSDVPDSRFSNTPGRGLNLHGYATGGTGNDRGATSIYNEDVYGAGYIGGSGSGRIAMKFTLTETDTIKGYHAFFGTLNCAWDDISFAVYSNSSNGLPGNLVQGSLHLSNRGYDELRNDFYWNEYITYIIEEPVVLQAGTYWAGIKQLGETGIEFGASKSRMGMRTTNISIPVPTNTGGEVGGEGISLLMEKTFRTIKDGKLVNKNLFASINSSAGTGWTSFSPTVGNPGYAHLHHFGISPADGQTATLSRGGWIPLLRPYFGEKSYRTVYDNCLIPVEMVYFTGDAIAKGISLEWATETEVNNYGYYIERREQGQAIENHWEAIGFVKGANNSSSRREYSYLDEGVQIGTTYQYRLRQVDFDGTFDCQSSGIITLTFRDVQPLELYSNRPNPFNDNTTISFFLPGQEYVTLEVVDIYGNVMNRLVSQTLNAGNRQFTWDGRDESGSVAPSGNYIYRLNAGGEVLTGKMVLVR